MENIKEQGRLMDIVIKAGYELKAFKSNDTTIVQVSDDWLVVCKNGEPISKFNKSIINGLTSITVKDK